MQRRVIEACSGKVPCVLGVVPHICVVGNHVDGVGRDRNWSSKVYLLPAGGGFVGKGYSREILPCGGPQVPNVSTRIASTLVKPDARNRSLNV